MIHERAKDGSCIKCVLKHVRAAKAGLETLQGIGVEFIRGPASARGTVATRAIILIREALAGYRENYIVAVENLALLETMAIPTKLSRQLREYRMLMEEALSAGDHPKKLAVAPILAVLCDVIDACIQEDAGEGMELTYAVDANLAEAARETPTEMDDGLKASLSDFAFLLGTYSSSNSMRISSFYVAALEQITYIISSIESTFELSAHTDLVEVTELGQNQSSSESEENTEAQEAVPGSMESLCQETGCQ